MTGAGGTMRRFERAARTLAHVLARLLALAASTVTLASAQTSNDGALRVRTMDRPGGRGAWLTWWRPTDAPARFAGPSPALLRQVGWREAAPGLDVAELTLSGVGEAWRVKVVLVRLDPARHRVQLHADVQPDGAVRPWSLASAPSSAVLALNAGQFTDAGPWGWLVHAGRELQPPATGPLSSAVVVGTGGALRVVGADSLPSLREAMRRGEVAEALQSYPTLLADDGLVPAALRASGRGIDVAHRDARLAIGTLRDGRVLVALTRFDALGDRLGAIPFGLTVPETAALMGALGCQAAVMLDGGISAQLAVQPTSGERREWRGLRRVPLGIVATRR